MQHTPHSRTRRRADVVVVGARCAGAATAMQLARAGHDVVLVDRRDPATDTLSTHAIARGGVVQLARWGLLDELVSTGAPPIRTVSFHVGDTVIRRTVKDRAGVDHLLAPRRDVLDGVLATNAAASGAALHIGVSVHDVTRDASGRVNGIVGEDADGSPVEVTARFVVGADGVRSRIARSVGAPVVDEQPSEGACHYAYYGGIEADGYEFHLGDRAFAGVFMTNDGEGNVWVACPADHCDRLRTAGPDRPAVLEQMIEEISPDLAARVRAAERTSRVRGAMRFPNHVRQGVGHGWALVGDASYHRDPVTGHGITDAFRDADLLAGALHRALTGECDDATALRTYEAERRQALQPIFELTCAMAAYPSTEEFAELQKQLSGQIEIEADRLARRPHIPAVAVAA